LVLACATPVTRAGSANLFYVSSLSNDEVLRYDAGTGLFIDTFIPASSNGRLDQPHGIIERESDVLVASFGTDQVLRFDRNTGAFLDVFIDATTGINNPVYLRYGPDGYFYVSSQVTDEIYRFCPDGQLLDVFIPAGSGGLDGPSGIAFGTDGRLYVAGRFSGSVLAYDASTGGFIETVMDTVDGLGTGNTFGLAFGGNGDLYVVSAGQVFRYDLDTASVIATVPVAGPIGLEPGGPNGGVIVASAGNLRAIDGQDNSVSSPLLSGGVINTLNFFHQTSPPPPVTADIDCDGIVGLIDLAALVDCLAGPGVAPAPTGGLAAGDCLRTFDGDHDGDIDLGDAAVFAVLVAP